MSHMNTTKSSKNVINYDLCLFDPFVQTNALLAYNRTFENLNLKAVLFTFIKHGSYNNISIIVLPQSRLLRHSPRILDLFAISTICSKTSLRSLVWMFEFFSLGLFIISTIRLIRNLRFKIISYTFENQTISDSVACVNKNIGKFSIRFNIDRLARRLVRYFIFECIFSPLIFIRKFDYLLCCSSVSKKFLVTRGVNSKQIGVCKYPVYVPPINIKKILRQDIFVGRLVEEKGILDLIIAYNSDYNRSNRTLLVLGEGPLDTKCKNLNINSRVIFLGKCNISRVYEYIASSENLLVPSVDIPNWSEQYPRVIEESLCLGTRVIARSNPTLNSIWYGLVDLIDHFDGGYLFNTIDSSATNEVIFQTAQKQFENFIIRNIKYFEIF